MLRRVVCLSPATACGDSSDVSINSSPNAPIMPLRPASTLHIFLLLRAVSITPQAVALMTEVTPPEIGHIKYIFSCHFLFSLPVIHLNTVYGFCNKPINHVTQCFFPAGAICYGILINPDLIMSACALALLEYPVNSQFLPGSQGHLHPPGHANLF